MEVFVGVKAGKGGCVWDEEEFSRDDGGVVVEDDAGIFAKVEECSADCCGADGSEAARNWGDLGGCAVGVEGSVDEEDGRHKAWSVGG